MLTQRMADTIPPNPVRLNLYHLSNDQIAYSDSPSRKTVSCQGAEQTFPWAGGQTYDRLIRNWESGSGRELPRSRGGEVHTSLQTQQYPPSCCQGSSGRVDCVRALWSSSTALQPLTSTYDETDARQRVTTLTEHPKEVLSCECSMVMV